MNVPAATRFVIPTVAVLVLTVCMQTRVWAQTKGSSEGAVPLKGLIIDPETGVPADLDSWQKGALPTMPVRDQR
jgi:hypothetical protein